MGKIIQKIIEKTKSLICFFLSLVCSLIIHNESVILIAEGVDYQDGMFEVTLIREIKNPMDLQAIVNAFITQKIDDCDMVYTFKTKDITFESKEEDKWTLDGEFGGIHNNVNLKVCQKAVDFIVKKRRKKEEKDLLN